MTVVYRADVRDVIGELLILAMILFYFPVKEAVRRDPRALQRLLLIIGWFALFVAVRNFFVFRRALSEAEYLWEIIEGRIALNEVILMMASLIALTLLIYARRFGEWITLLVAFVVSFAGLVITQSRAYWASFLLGTLLLFIFVEWRKKGQILLMIGGGLGGFALLGWLIYPDFVRLIVVGLVDRFVSLSTAFTDDISLVNRFYETGQVWEYVKQNPVVGYGAGTAYQYYNVIYKVTRDWSFIHNGYISLWFKFGVFGLAFMLYFWLASIVNGFRLFRNRKLDRETRLAGLAAAVCLSAETLVANTSNPFLIADATLLMAMLAGVVSGLRQRVKMLPVSGVHDTRE
jgi:O-antigen ligase